MRVAVQRLTRSSWLPLSLVDVASLCSGSGFCFAAADIEGGHGDGGQSIYGPTFADECFAVKHSTAGILVSAVVV